MLGYGDEARDVDTTDDSTSKPELATTSVRSKWMPTPEMITTVAGIGTALGSIYADPSGVSAKSIAWTAAGCFFLMKIGPATAKTIEIIGGALVKFRRDNAMALDGTLRWRVEELERRITECEEDRERLNRRLGEESAARQRSDDRLDDLQEQIFINNKVTRPNPSGSPPPKGVLSDGAQP